MREQMAGTATDQPCLFPECPGLSSAEQAWLRAALLGLCMGVIVLLFQHSSTNSLPLGLC